MCNDLLNQAWQTPCGSPFKKLLLARLADRADKSGLAWPSVESLMADCEMCDRAVRKLLKELEQDGFIRVERRGGRHLTNRYWVVKRKPASSAPLQEKPCTPYSVSGARNPAPHAENPAPDAGQPSGTPKEPKGERNGKTPPYVFDKEFQNRIKLADEEIERLKCNGSLSEIDRERIRFLRGKQKEWKDTIFNR